MIHDARIWTVPFYVVRVIDGDTIRGDADLGWAIWKKNMDVRVENLWCPETNTDEGKAAKAYAESLLAVGLRMTLQSKWLLTFSRVVGHLYLPDGSSYAETVISAGHGKVTQ